MNPQRLLLLVEGQSEEIFVKRTLSEHLVQHGVYVEEPIVCWTKRVPSGGGYRGGVSHWKQIKDNLELLIRDSNAWVSTLLDFYGLPEDVPGYQEACGLGNPRDKVVALQERLRFEINHPRFIPFLALHEFEAWLFCAPDVVADHFGQTRLAEPLRRVVQEAGAPELINHGKDTHPKARLKNLVGSYKEISDGATIIRKIGLERVRLACPHFDNWLHQLELLGGGAE